MEWNAKMKENEKKWNKKIVETWREKGWELMEWDLAKIGMGFDDRRESKERWKRKRMRVEEKERLGRHFSRRKRKKKKKEEKSPKKEEQKKEWKWNIGRERIGNRWNSSWIQNWNHCPHYLSLSVTSFTVNHSSSDYWISLLSFFTFHLLRSERSHKMDIFSFATVRHYLTIWSTWHLFPLFSLHPVLRKGSKVESRPKIK